MPGALDVPDLLEQLVTASVPMPTRPVRTSIMFRHAVRFVTAPVPDGTGLSSRGGLTRAQPGPGRYVACPVDVGVDRAVRGTDHCVLPGAGAFPPAYMTVNAGAGGVHEHHSPSGTFSLGGEDGRELCPARVENRFVQSSASQHRAAASRAPHHMTPSTPPAETCICRFTRVTIRIASVKPGDSPATQRGQIPVRCLMAAA